MGVVKLCKVSRQNNPMDKIYRNKFCKFVAKFCKFIEVDINTLIAKVCRISTYYEEISNFYIPWGINLERNLRK